MKKTLAAVAVLGAFAGSAFAADVTMYGRVDAGLLYQRVDSDVAHQAAENSWGLESGNMTGSRFGVKGSEQITDDITVSFTLENGFKSDTGNFGTDGKFFDRERGFLDVNYYDYGSLMGTTFGMDKKQRIQTFASGSSHAMTLMAVDLDQNGKPKKWMVENSWGPGANAGHLIMTDQWFNEYMFRLVVNKKYITDKVKEVLKQKPTRLPAWDPMFADED